MIAVLLLVGATATPVPEWRPVEPCASYETRTAVLDKWQPTWQGTLGVWYAHPGGKWLAWVHPDRLLIFDRRTGELICDSGERLQ